MKKVVEKFLEMFCYFAVAAASSMTSILFCVPCLTVISCQLKPPQKMIYKIIGKCIKDIEKYLASSPKGQCQNSLLLLPLRNGNKLKLVLFKKGSIEGNFDIGLWELTWSNFLYPLGFYQFFCKSNFGATTYFRLGFGVVIHFSFLQIWTC